jgi:hypothetical protein
MSAGQARDRVRVKVVQRPRVAGRDSSRDSTATGTVHRMKTATMRFTILSLTPLAASCSSLFNEVGRGYGEALWNRPGPRLLLAAQLQDRAVLLESPTEPMSLDEEPCGRVFGEATGGLLWFVAPLNYESRYDVAYRNALATAPGSHRLVDVWLWDTWAFTPVGLIQTLYVEGTAVRRVDTLPS